MHLGPTFPPTFINHVLWDLSDQFVIAYLDNILIFSEDPDQHLSHVWTVLQKLGQHDLSTTLEKCAFDQTTIKFFGFILSPEGLKMDPPEGTSHPRAEGTSECKGTVEILGVCQFLLMAHCQH